MNTIFNSNRPFTHEEVYALMRTLPRAVSQAYISLMGGNTTDVYKLGRNEYLITITRPDGEVYKYGVMNARGFHNLQADVYPFATSDHAYPRAIADALTTRCYYTSEARPATDD